MSSALAPVAVLADQLQADGDLRGELLALELAAALADSTEESRRLCLAAHALRIRNRHLAWPPALADCRGVIRAGLLVAGTWRAKRTPDLPTRVGPWCRDLVVLPGRAELGLQALYEGHTRNKLRLDGFWQPPNAMSGVTTLDLEPEQALELPALGIAQRMRNPEVLRQVHGLARLDTNVLTDELLATLPALALRSLTVGWVSEDAQRHLLDACPLLEELTLRISEQGLEPHSGLERLRALALVDQRSDRPRHDKLAGGLSLPRLESLFLSAPTRRDIERIAGLRLRRLVIHEPSADHQAIVDLVAKLDSLEHLGLLWASSESNIAPLSGLTRLRSLELGHALMGELHAPATLECVAFRWPGKVRIHGVVPTVLGHFRSIDELEERVDLASVKTLELSTTWGFGQQLEGPERLASLETLVLDGADFHPKWMTWLKQLPRLRTIIWPHLSIQHQRGASERLPHSQITGADLPRLLDRWPRPLAFDPLAPSNWPKCE